MARPNNRFLDKDGKPSELRVQFIDGKIWKLTEGLEYHLGSPDGKEMVIVPAGFLTDFASIPRALWPVIGSPTGLYGKGAVLHDFLYRVRVVISMGEVTFHEGGLHSEIKTRLVNRGEADGIFREAMEVLGVGWFKRQTIYWGLRAGGWAAWRSARKAEGKAEGEGDE